jgi:hypothetical protein
MNAATLSNVESARSAGWLLPRLLNVFAAPNEVLDEVLARRFLSRNWLVPTILVVLSGTWLMDLSISTQGNALLTDTGVSTAAGLSKERVVVGIATAGLTAVGGTLWSAFLLWFMGNVFLKSRFSYLKTLELVGLVQMILVLGTVVTGLLVMLLNDPRAQPGLMIFALKMKADPRVEHWLQAFNLFHFWTAALLTQVLSRLSGASYKECAFWVFGYWIVLRLTLVLLVG